MTSKPYPHGLQDDGRPSKLLGRSEILRRPSVRIYDYSHGPSNTASTASNPTIARRLGFPVALHRIHPDKAWKDVYNNDHRATAFTKADSGSEVKVGSNNNQDVTALDNPGITSMYMEYDCDPHSKNWGQATAEWQQRMGSVLVIRKDGKRLHPHHVEALCHYCQYELQPMFKHAKGTGSEQTTKEQVLASITPEKISEFFEKYRKGKGREDASWLTVENPCKPVDDEESGNEDGAEKPPDHAGITRNLGATGDLSATGNPGVTLIPDVTRSPVVTHNPDSDYSDDDYDDNDSNGIDDIIDDMQDLPRYGSNRNYK